MVVKSKTVMYCVNAITSLFGSNGYIAIAIPPFIFTLNGVEENSELITHEKIHLLQWKELFYIGFPLIYYYYYFRNLFFLKNTRKAYYSNPFEIEAYAFQSSAEHLKNREALHWKKFTEGYKNIV